MRTVNIHEAKTNFSKLVDEAAGGEDVIIAKAGKPVAKLVAYGEPRPKLPLFGGLEHLAGPWIDEMFSPEADQEIIDMFEESNRESPLYFGPIPEAGTDADADAEIEGERE